MKNRKFNNKVDNDQIKLKIAMIGHKRVPSREGGIEIVVEQISTRLVKAGHKVDIYNRKGHHVSGKKFGGNSNNRIKEYKGIRIITIPTFQNQKLNALVYSILSTLRAIFGKYDVIHYHAEGPCAMLWLPHFLGIRTVATIHGLDWQRAKWGGFASKYLKFGEKIAAKYADEIIVLSRNTKNYFFETYKRNVNFIPNGIEKPLIPDWNIIKYKWGLKKNEYILYLGRIVPEKGLHYLIDAYLNIHTDKKLVVAGGSSHTDEYMINIKNKTANDKRVIFTDFVQGDVLSALYSNAYIYVLPSDLEGMPISLLEAMSYGNCCLVSDIAECTEVVEDKAMIFKKGNIIELEDRLQILCDDPDLVRRYKENITEFVCDKYNWTDVVNKTLALYKNLHPDTY